jgi:hypothetical protein
MRAALFSFLPLVVACTSATAPAPKGAPAPQRAQVAQVEEDCVSPNDIQKALSARSMGFQDCYADALANDPTLSGTITLEVVVPPSGQVSKVTARESSLNNPSVVRCIEEVASGLTFPQEECSLAQSVEYPVRLARGSSEFALR